MSSVEIENTARALKDEMPLVTSVWCYLGFHRWEQWSPAYLPSNRGYVNVQHKYCSNCRKMKVRRIYKITDI